MTTTTQYITTDISQLSFSKAKKKEGYYICPVKGEFTICFDKVSIINIKDTSNTLIIKTKDKEMTKFMDDFNNKILETVIQNSPSWFNTNMDTDLIEEYYISTLQYDKQKGETIRLKIKNIDDIEEAKELNGNVSLALSLKYLKFFKQKFYPEFQVEVIEALDNNENSLEMYSDEEYYADEEEHPVPSHEEVMLMKEECMKTLRNHCNELTEKLCEIEKEYNDSFEKLSKLGNSEKSKDIIELCEMYTNLNTH
jgi:hypothetical protein